MNNIVHRELRRAFEKITVVADEIGSSDYMHSFCEYVNKQQDMPNLFGDAEFRFENSKGNIGIQLADLISGTLSYVLIDTNGRMIHPPIWRFLRKKPYALKCILRLTTLTYWRIVQ